MDAIEGQIQSIHWAAANSLMEVKCTYVVKYGYQCVNATDYSPHSCRDGQVMSNYIKIYIGNVSKFVINLSHVKLC